MRILSLGMTMLQLSSLRYADDLPDNKPKNTPELPFDKELWPITPPLSTGPPMITPDVDSFIESLHKNNNVLNIKNLGHQDIEFLQSRHEQLETLITRIDEYVKNHTETRSVKEKTTLDMFRNRALVKQAELLSELGSRIKHHDNKEKSCDYIMKAEEVEAKISVPVKKIVGFKFDLANCYRYTNPHKAISYLKDISDSEITTHRLLIKYTFLGDSFGVLGDYENAKNAYQKGLGIYTTIENPTVEDQYIETHIKNQIELFRDSFKIKI